MYIRTKDGVYEVEQSQLEDDEEVVNCEYGQIGKLEILRKSENLEELCDCFVTEGNRHIVWDKQQNKGITFEQVKESFPSYHFKIYGAVWCEFGLKYIAKLNSKGELELL